MKRFDRRSFLLQGAAAGAVLALPENRACARVGSGLPSLAALISGPVIGPGDAAYAQARLPYNERYDGVRPRGIAQPVSVDDVRRIVTWSRRTGVPLAIRSGGHSYAGYSTTTGIVVDLGRLRSISLSPSGIATIGAGARLVDIEAALAQHGRAIPAGSCATVGIGGLALGGGVGFASRKFGTTSDNIVSLGIVTADGRHRTCSATEQADLYWACRGGGGGNFGVVTHFELRTHPVPAVSYFFADWPWSQLDQVVKAWQAFAPHAPDELFSICAIQTGSGSPTVKCFGQLLGPQSRLDTLLAPLKRVAGLQLTLGASAYFDAQLRWAGCLGKTVTECHIAGEAPGGTLGRASFAAKSDYVNAPLSSAAIATIGTWIERAQSGGFGSASLLLDSYGGAINRMPEDATAFVHRNALGSGQYLVYWYEPGNEAAAVAWLRGFHTAMRPYVSGFAYQNYIDRDLASWRHAYYGANYARLRHVKSVVDPDRLFHFPQGIAPA